MRRPCNTCHKGFTLIELLVSMGIFSIICIMMYETFNFISKQSTTITTTQNLTEKGQRILTLMEEDIRMIGFLLGPDARIPYCTGGVVPSTPNVLTYTSGTPYDSLTFITSKPVALKETAGCASLFTPGDSGAQKDCVSGTTTGTNADRIDYNLTTRCEAVAGSSSLTVDASYTNSTTNCFDDVVPLTSSSDTNNGRSLVTFDSLLLSAAAIAGSAPQVYYSLSKDSGGTSLTFLESGGLQQNIPDNSTVYAVRQYAYSVDTTGGKRNLQRIGKKSNCNDDPLDLIETVDTANNLGGVDGLKFQFNSYDPVSNKIITSSTLPALNQLKSITIWLLLRSERPDTSYTNTTTYTLGTATGLTFNDHYRRVLLSKTVEVKNLASIN